MAVGYVLLDGEVIIPKQLVFIKLVPDDRRINELDDIIDEIIKLMKPISEISIPLYDLSPNRLEVDLLTNILQQGFRVFIGPKSQKQVLDIFLLRRSRVDEKGDIVKNSLQMPADLWIEHEHFTGTGQCQLIYFHDFVVPIAVGFD